MPMYLRSSLASRSAARDGPFVLFYATLFLSGSPRIGNTSVANNGWARARFWLVIAPDVLIGHEVIGHSSRSDLDGANGLTSGTSGPRHHRATR